MMAHETLHWDRADNTETIEGSGTLEGFYGLPEGAMVPIEVEHLVDGDFHWAEAPRFAEAPGVAYLLDCSYTGGSQFRVMALRTDEVGGGWTGYAYADLDYSWTRTGGLK
jgi:2-hydroxychromene-2-carboxylate isomerase